MHQELKEAIVRILQVAKENNKSTGIYAVSGEQAREFADQGFHMVSCIFDFLRDLLLTGSPQISVVADMVALPMAMTSALAAAKGSYAHSALNLAKGAASKITSR